MTGARALLQNLWVNPLSVVTDPQTEGIRVVFNCGFDSTGESVLEGIAQRLPSNPVDFVLEQ